MIDGSLTSLIKDAAIVVGAYAGFSILGFLAELNSEHIESQEQLERIVKEEAPLLDLDTLHLVPTFYRKEDKEYNKITGTCSFVAGLDLVNKECFAADKINNTTIIPVKYLDMKEGHMATRRVVRHELYHLKKKHSPSPKNSIVKFLKNLYREPAATLYAVTGIESF
jgi:hypothetical protein